MAGLEHELPNPALPMTKSLLRDSAGCVDALLDHLLRGLLRLGGELLGDVVSDDDSV